MFYFPLFYLVSWRYKLWPHSRWSIHNHKLWLWCTNWWIWYVHICLMKIYLLSIVFWSIFICVKISFSLSNPPVYFCKLFAGLARFPKWEHLKELHRAIKLCEHALLNNEPKFLSLGQLQEVIFCLLFSSLYIDTHICLCIYICLHL